MRIRATDQFRLWRDDHYFAPETRRELAALAEGSAEVQDRFYRSLEFGTGGLRGVLGAGTNRMNLYTVRLAAHGLARYILSFGPAAAARGVVIAHDPRRLSPEFALETALTLNASGIPAYIWKELRPTPLLSYAVRELQAIGGVVITASHNPPEYNGFKVYWEDGGQVAPERAAQIQQEMQAIGDITSIVPMPAAEARSNGLLRLVPPQIDRSYTDRLQTLLLSQPQQRAACRILYTPLHGSGNVPVRTGLSEAGFQVQVVPEQEAPDPDFATVSSPNPEEAEVFALALRQAEAAAPDVIMATDPDADRLGVVARDRNGQYRLLTGNQIGAVLVDYLLAGKGADLPANGAVVTTIATSNMVAPLCRHYGVTLLQTHTGFKFIGDKIREFEESGSHTFLFGFEESYGYLGATFVRDKDAVMAAVMVADAVAFYKDRGQTLYDALEQIWQRCGFFQEALYNKTFHGKEGQEAMAALMDRLRRNPPRAFASIALAAVDDYWTGTGFDCQTGAPYPLHLGQANVLHYRFADGGFVMVRPSGTEPKLKVYLSVVGASLADAGHKLRKVQAAVLQYLGLQ